MACRHKPAAGSFPAGRAHHHIQSKNTGGESRIRIPVRQLPPGWCRQCRISSAMPLQTIPGRKPGGNQGQTTLGVWSYRVLASSRESRQTAPINTLVAALKNNALQQRWKLSGYYIDHGPHNWQEEIALDHKSIRTQVRLVEVRVSRDPAFIQGQDCCFCFRAFLGLMHISIKSK